MNSEEEQLWEQSWSHLPLQTACGSVLFPHFPWHCPWKFLQQCLTARFALKTWNRQLLLPGSCLLYTHIQYGVVFCTLSFFSIFYFPSCCCWTHAAWTESQQRTVEGKMPLPTVISSLRALSVGNVSAGHAWEQTLCGFKQHRSKWYSPLRRKTLTNRDGFLKVRKVQRGAQVKRKEEISLEKSSRAAGNMKCTTLNPVSAQTHCTLERQNMKEREYVKKHLWAVVEPTPTRNCQQHQAGNLSAHPPQ